MKPINFKQSTKVLQKPGTMTDKECASLHVWCDGEQCVSCWKPSIKERIRIAFGGNVWLGVKSGKTQPPVFVAGERVFDEPSIWDHLRVLFNDGRESIAKVSEKLSEVVKQGKKDVYLFAAAAASSIATCFWGIFAGFAVGFAIGGIMSWWDSEEGTIGKMDVLFILVGCMLGVCLSVPVMKLCNI